MLEKAFENIENAEEVRKQLDSIHLTRRVGTPEEVAGLVGYLCGPDGGFITGHSIRIDGGLGVMLGGN